MTPESVLEEAHKIIYGDREQTYGHPAKNLNAIATMWVTYLRSKGALLEDSTISANDVCMMMILVKVARQANTFKRDNLVDICGYAALPDRIENFVEQSDHDQSQLGNTQGAT